MDFFHIFVKNTNLRMRTEQEKALFNRTERLVGTDIMDRFAAADVILFGVGGVGSWCAEALVRSGIRSLTLVDPDRVCVTNVNRQLMALPGNVGEPKVEALKARLLEINPDAHITALQEIFSEETASRFDLDRYDYILDAIDSLKDKAALIRHGAAARGTFFSSMGAAVKLDPTRVRVAAFADVRGCPLGAALRKKMRREGTFPERPFLCVYDDELLPNLGSDEDPAGAVPGSFKKAQVNGTAAPLTGIFGMTLAGLVLQDIYQKNE